MTSFSGGERPGLNAKNADANLLDKEERAHGQYKRSEINMAKLVTFLRQGEKEGDIAMMRQDREWAAEQGLKRARKKKA